MKRTNDIIIETIMTGIGIAVTSAVTFAAATIVNAVKEGVENYGKPNSKKDRY